MDEHAIRAIIFYESRRGSSTRQATDNINAALGEGTVSQSTVNRWFRHFASGDTSLKNQERSGRPIELKDDVLLGELQAHPDATTRELAQALGYTHGNIENRLHALGYRRVLARWTPHQLSTANRAARVSICQSLLFHPQRKEFLANLVTGDESWILYKNDTRAAYWTPREEEPPAQPKMDTHGRKVLLCCWWDERGMIYYELLTGGETVTADVYVSQLRKLAAALREKRRRMVEVHLLHDNARPHVASATRQQLEELGWTTVPHPPYSPDLAPSDYHLFRSLKSFLRGQRFSDFDNLKNALANFFERQPAEFWKHGIQSLPNRWRHVIDKFGDYIVD
jgi:histone-lysine N-methyltransferase SETMAR